MNIDYTIIDEISKKYNDLYFIIIGAMDGIHYDNLIPFLTKNKLNGLFIEPIPQMYDKLRNNYKNYEGILAFENCAISEKEGKVKMYKVPDSKIGSVYPEWTDGCSTLYLEKSVIKNFEPEEIFVQSHRLENVLSKHKIEKIDIIQIDTEGADYEIFNAIDFEIYKPKFIAIEIMNLTYQEVQNIKEKLETLNYKINIIVDLLAISEECFIEIENNKK